MHRSNDSFSNLIRLRFPFRRRGRVPFKQCSRVLLLQGPVGPFFTHLSSYLEQAGFDVWRISFNAGDRIFAPSVKRVDFSGNLVEWENWFRSFLAGAQFDHIVLFGSSRPIHIVARRIASALGIPVVSLEEGYIRPGYVTVEIGGNNADSPLAGSLPPANFKADLSERKQAGFSSFPAMCRRGVAYYAASTLLSTFGERSLFHRRFSPLLEPFLWGRNVQRRFAARGRDFCTIERLLEHYEGRYFLVPMQVAADTQMKVAARGWTTQQLIIETLSSFAHSAPLECRLVFKVHPLERGHTNARRFIGQVAQSLGLADRVDVLDIGSLSLLTRHAAGMITINSTSGLSAIFHGVPLMVLGDAIYAHQALATVAHDKPDFDGFWTKGFVADAELRRRYLAWIKQEALVPGDFYDGEGMASAYEGILKKIQDSAMRVQHSDLERQAC